MKKPKLEGQIIDILLPEKTYVSFDQLEEEIVQPDRKCPLCDYFMGPPENPGENPALDGLWYTYAKHRDTISIRGLAKLISRYHELHIYKHQVLQEDTEYLDPDTVYHHLVNNHMNDPKLRLRIKLEKLHILEQKVLQGVVYSEGNLEGAMKGSAQSVDPKAIQNLALINKMQLDCIKAGE